MQMGTNNSSLGTFDPAITLLGPYLLGLLTLISGGWASTSPTFPTLHPSHSSAPPAPPPWPDIERPYLGSYLESQASPVGIASLFFPPMSDEREGVWKTDLASKLPLRRTLELPLTDVSLVTHPSLMGVASPEITLPTFTNGKAETRAEMNAGPWAKAI